MMKYAVVKISGHQYKVSEGTELAVDRLPQAEGKEIELEEVLLLVDDGQTKIGQPHVDKAKIKAKILKNIRGEKIRVARFRAKSRYRKVKGFRAALTNIKIEKITFGEDVKKEVKEAKKVKKLAEPKKVKKVTPKKKAS